MTWMSYIMHYVQKVLLIRVPPSNESNYFIDPKIMTLGEPDFEPRKIDYKISELKFLQMRQDMINIGGERLKRTKSIYLLLVAFTVLGFMACLAELGLAFFFYKELEEYFKITLIVDVVGLVIPNIILQIYWRHSMKKTCSAIEDYFYLQNKDIYSVVGINWVTCETLLYINIRLVDKETELRSFEEFSNSTRLSRLRKAEKNLAIETKRDNSNREILLNNYQR